MQGWKAATSSPRPASGRQGMLLPVEGERWQLILTGVSCCRACFTMSGVCLHIYAHQCQLGVPAGCSCPIVQQADLNAYPASFSVSAVAMKKCVMTVLCTGLAGDHPPTDEEGYLEFARSLPSPEIYDALTQAEPLGPIHVFNRTENVKRSYGQVWLVPTSMSSLANEHMWMPQCVHLTGMQASAMGACKHVSSVCTQAPPQTTCNHLLLGNGLRCCDFYKQVLSLPVPMQLPSAQKQSRPLCVQPSTLGPECISLWCAGRFATGAVRAGRRSDLL